MHDPIVYYTARVSEFGGRLESAQSDTLKTLLRSALSLTKAAALRITELADLANRVAPFAKQLFEQTSTNIGNDVETSAQLLARLNEIIENPSIDPELKKSTALITHRALSSAQTAATTSIATAEMFSQVFVISVTLLVDTLSLKLFRPDHTKFIANAVREGLMAAIGTLPIIGDVASTIQSIRDVVSFSDDQFRGSDDYVAYLESYINAAKLWNDSATKIITLYEGAITPSQSP